MNSRKPGDICHLRLSVPMQIPRDRNIGVLDLAELDQDTKDSGISVTARAWEVFAWL